MPAAANAAAPPIRRECDDVLLGSRPIALARSFRHKLKYLGFNVQFTAGKKKKDLPLAGLDAFANSHSFVVMQYTWFLSSRSAILKCIRLPLCRFIFGAENI